MVIATDRIYVNRVEQHVLACDINGIMWKVYQSILVTSYNKGTLNTDIKRKL